MTESKQKKNKARTLRRLAEEKVRAEEVHSRETLTPEETRQVLHELRVHQIELEMQNEELRATQEQLEASRERYFDLYDLAPVGYFTLSEEGFILEANLTAAVMLGVARNDLVKQPLTRFILPADQDIYYRHRKQLFKTGAVQVCELRIKKKDGPQFWANVEATEAQGDDGMRVLRTVISDITERKQIEDAQLFLSLSGYKRVGEDFFKLLAQYLAESLHMHYVCIDRLEGDGLEAKTLAVYCEGTFEDNIQYTLNDTPCGDVVGKTICSYPKDVRRLFPRDAVLQEMQAESYVGTTLWSAAGKPIGLIAVIGRQPLITPRPVERILQLVSVRAAGELERLQYERFRQEHLDRLNSLVNISVEVIRTTTSQELLQLVVDAAREITGAGTGAAGYGYNNGMFRFSASSHSPAEQPCPADELFAPETARVYFDIIRRGDSVRYTDEQVRSLPERQGFRLQQGGLCICPLTGDDGGVNGLIMVSGKGEEGFTEIDHALLTQQAALASLALQHIEARNFLEVQTSELTAANANLHEEIRRRKMVEEVLTQYMNNLKESNEELDKFASIVSHDLQEPLRSVIGFLKLLDKKYGEGVDEKGQEYITRSLKNSQRLETMINNLLAYSRITTRGGNFVEHELEDDLRDALENLGSTLERTDTAVTHEPLPRVYGDTYQLVRVFQNLIGNSIKYHGTEPPFIHVAVEQQGDEYIISVRDNGIGIDPAYHRDIFNLFNRYPGRDQNMGTGIGLAVCKKIVERHKGRIWIESEPGRGATIFFSIPAGGEVKEFKIQQGTTNN